jgi:Gram-negative bacterial TonB protein C-terminal
MRHPRSRTFWLLLLLSLASAATSQEAPSNGGDFSQGSTVRIPDNVILVKGAWSSASDAVTPLPEGGRLDSRSYGNPYFSLELPLPKGWVQKYEGPPPSDSGYYVLAQLRPAQPAPGQPRGSLLVAAQDLFFSTAGATDPLQLVNYTRDHLQADYRVEGAPRQVMLAGRTFVRLDYGAPAAGLHWALLATQIRCHVVEFVATSADPRLVEGLTRGLNEMKFGGDDTPVCLANYAVPANILHREDPVFSEHRYNPIPVRVIIDRDGKVKHVHFLSAFPSQSQALTSALMQWRFRPYLRDGQPVEVETGILFGRAPRGAF